MMKRGKYITYASGCTLKEVCLIAARCGLTFDEIEESLSKERDRK